MYTRGMVEYFSHTLQEVPVDGVWVHCPVCDERAVTELPLLVCTACDFVAEAPPPPGEFSLERQRWEGHVPAFVAAAHYAAAVRAKCTGCGTWREYIRHYPSPPADHIDLTIDLCPCEALQTITEFRWLGAPSTVATDRTFRLPYWLQMPFAGNTLWAANPEHLAYLQWFVSSPRRPREGLGTTLPHWITSARYHSYVLRGLAALERRAASVQQP
ncbi:MAG: hypothetical protein JWQ19_1118 [Subtercola sp.]|nr:hypothetical protein [Subtercola sp.]